MFGRGVTNFIRHITLNSSLKYNHQVHPRMAFSSAEVSRYSRQLLLPEIGAEGQRKLKSASVLIVGCGGLGCPAGLYLAAAGIGKIGLVDDDVVELNNLHRQILHNETRIGTLKTESAAATLSQLNSNIELELFNKRLNRSNALDIVNKFDIVMDATDNALTRYLLSDVCVLSKKPLVSGSALRFDGQLTVYNYDSNSPCYRCLFPSPPPAATITNCSDGGVLGVVPGIIGSLQALEIIKITLGIKPAYSGKLLLFDGMEGSFKTVQIRGKREDCISCSTNATIGEKLMDYEAFCGVGCAREAPVSLKILEPDERISCVEYKEEVLDKNRSHLLIDVRPKLETEITKLSHSINIPLKELQTPQGLERMYDLIEDLGKEAKCQVFVMCRRGNASQRAVRYLKDNLDQADQLEIKDLIGGIEDWSKSIDPSIPVY